MNKETINIANFRKIENFNNLNRETGKIEKARVTLLQES